MRISDWFTIISVLSAFLGFLIQNELRLFFAKLFWREKIITGYLLLIQIPILLFYSEISTITLFSFLKHSPFFLQNGIAPENLAFILVLSFFAYILFRLYWWIPQKKMSEYIYSIYSAIAEQNQAILPDLIRKYESVDFINANWNKYEAMFDDEMILKILVPKCPALLLSIWHNFNHEKAFQKVFRLFLENPNSAYYSERNSYRLPDDKPFLNTVTKDNLKQSIHNGILMVFTDYVSKHLQVEYGKESTYNREHYYPKTREVEGFEFPIYYHIHFIGLMYSSAIENKIDISAISDSYSNMQTIYSSMIEQMINNIIVTEENANKKYPTNYHWLIGEIFNLQRNWLSSFSDERYFDEKSSYITFIPNSLSFCLSELYNGVNKKKITIEFLSRVIYYNILSHYFIVKKEPIKQSIENTLIGFMPNEWIKPVFDFALDEKFAINFDDFINENFRLINNNEREILLRLLQFLRANKKI